MSYDGKQSDDVKLWHTYMHQAKAAATALPGVAASLIPAICDDEAQRLRPEFAKALDATMHAAFALEYRIKRVLEERGLRIRDRSTGLSKLVKIVWLRLAAVERSDGKGKCAEPAEWKALVPTLQRLAKVRNDIAHAN